MSKVHQAPSALVSAVAPRTEMSRKPTSDLRLERSSGESNHRVSRRQEVTTSMEFASETPIATRNGSP
jgi:hypothetical protein